MRNVSEIVQEERNQQDMRAMLREWRETHGKCPNCGESLHSSVLRVPDKVIKEYGLEEEFRKRGLI